MNKNPLEQAMDFPILIGKEMSEIPVEGLVTPNVGEVLKKFKGRSLRSRSDNRPLGH